MNGGKHFRSVVYKDVSLADWLLDSPGLENLGNKDIYAVGFEEIVDLNASNIMAVSSENARSWADELTKVRIFSLQSKRKSIYNQVPIIKQSITND